MLCLPLDLIPGWLFGIQIGRIGEDIRPKLIRYRREWSWLWFRMTYWMKECMKWEPIRGDAYSSRCCPRNGREGKLLGTKGGRVGLGLRLAGWSGAVLLGSLTIRGNSTAVWLNYGK